MFWSSEKSVKLSLILTYVFFALLVAAVFALPWIIGWYVEIAGKSPSLATTLMVTSYPCIPFLAVATLSLRRLLVNITKSEVFIERNLQMLRRISWCCVFVCVITVIAGFFYLPFLITGIAFGFFALAVRVVKNLFDAAIKTKGE